MTACTNHGGKARRVVTAALVGVLSVGTVPMVALATGANDGIETMFATPDGAFTNAKVVNAGFSHLGTWKDVEEGDYGVYETTYDAYSPVILDWFEVQFFGTSESDTFKITASSEDYEVSYYERDSKGNPTGSEIKSDIYSVGKYVAKVEAVGGHYKGGVIYVPFDINPIELSGAKVVGSSTLTYNAESHDFRFSLVDGNGVTHAAQEGIDYTVEYVRTGHDTSNVADVKDEGTYVAKITGIGNWEGSVTLSERITVKPLDLNTTLFIGLVKAGDPEIKNIYGLFIDGKWYTGDDAIMSELKAELDPDSQVWFQNGYYSYRVYPAKSGDTNIINDGGFGTYKVENELDFLYKGSAIPTEHEVIINEPDTKWDSSKVTAHADNGTKDGVNVANGDITETIYDASGVIRSSRYMNSHAGSYTVLYQVSGTANEFEAGGQALVNVTVYNEAVDADAQAAVLYDVDGDGTKEVVTSIETTYDGTDVRGDIAPVVEDADGNRLQLGIDYTVRYYNADGTEVAKLIDAGTYTLKLTSDTYKLSGTTEMTITINKVGAATAKVGALTSEPWDNAGNETVYLPWQSDGVTLDELNLRYKDGDDWVPFPMNMVKATILDASGNEVKKITEEGVYTVHFEARNPSGENNFVVPADITFHCVQNYNDFANDVYNHVTFADVSYTDYYCDSVAWVKAKGFMNGYNGTRLFGPEDDITRGMVASILYNMAGGDNLGLDEDKFYNELVGWKSFDDVDGKAYYGRAIAWAKEAGVVNGYDDGTFRPDQAVSRQEFAGMLANYAERFDSSFKAAGADALDEMPDAGEVADWAKEAVAWAVENGIMGNGGFIAPGSTIIRADAAGMVFNYAK